jgi:hypothetical protein
MLNWMSKMRIGLADNTLSATYEMKGMAFSNQNHIHCKLAINNDITEKIHNFNPLTPELMTGGTCRR